MPATEQSLFKNHLLETKDFNPRPNSISDQYWISCLLLLIFTIYVWLKIAYRKKIKQNFNAFFTNRAITQLSEEQALSSRLSVFLSIIFVVVWSLFIYQLNSFYGWHLSSQSGLLFYLQLCAIIVLTYFVKMETVKLLGFIFKTENESSEYIFNIFLFNKMTGLFLLPVVVCIAFCKQISPHYFIHIGLILLALMFLYRSLRGFIIAFGNSKISRFYLFVYLCTLEILPLIVLTKTFMGKNLILN